MVRNKKEWYNATMIWLKKVVEDWENMELVRIGAKGVKFYLDIAFLSQYELDIETFEKRKPFTARIVDDLLNYANEKYGLDFDGSDTPKAVYAVAESIVVVFEKRNQICFKSEENEEFKIMKSIRKLFRSLPDEKIYFGMMEIEEKRRLLEEIRNDDDMAYIRENFIMSDWGDMKMNVVVNCFRLLVIVYNVSIPFMWGWMFWH